MLYSNHQQLSSNSISSNSISSNSINSNSGRYRLLQSVEMQPLCKALLVHHTAGEHQVAGIFVNDDDADSHSYVFKYC